MINLDIFYCEIYTILFIKSLYIIQLLLPSVLSLLMFNGKKSLIKLLRTIPIIDWTIKKKLKKVQHSIVEENFIECNVDEYNLETLISDSALQYQKSKEITENGSFSGTFYGNLECSPELLELVSQNLFVNYMHADVFKLSIKKIKALCLMTAKMYNFDVTGFVGFTTIGGSVSNYDAMRSYCKYTTEKNRDLFEFLESKPIILAPISAHTSILNKSKDFGKIIEIPLKDDYTVDLKIMEQYLILYGGRVACIVGSTPCYSYGTSDDIERLEYLKLKYNVGLHVDSCMGSSIYPYSEDYKKWKHVDSWTCDWHKHLHSMKGSSGLIIRKKYARYMYYSHSDWTGGICAFPSIPGSSTIVPTVISLYNFLTIDTKKIYDDIMFTKKYIIEIINENDHFEICGNPKQTIVAFKCAHNDCDGKCIYSFIKSCSKYNVEFKKLQYPPAAHICLTHAHTQVEDFIDRVEKCVNEWTHEYDCKELSMGMYCQAIELKCNGLENELDDLSKDYIETLYSLDDPNILNVEKDKPNDIMSKFVELFM